MRRDQSKWWAQGYTQEWWDTQTRGQREMFLSKLTPAQVEEFFHDWRVWAHDYQIPPETAWEVWLFMAGRGAGKTRSAVEYITDCVEAGWSRRIAIVGQGEDDVRNVMVEGDSGFIACAKPNFKPVFKPSAGGGKVIWPNGCTAFIYSIADTESLRGPQFHIGWCDEPMAAPRVQRERALDNLEFCLRLVGQGGEQPRMILTTTPKPDPWLRKMERDAKKPENGIFISRAHTDANARNLAESFLRRVHRKYDGTRIGKQEIRGEILTDEEGALWTEDSIALCRLEDEDPVEVAASCDRVLVSIDPNTKGGETTAAKSKKIAHAAGIIVLGRRGKERFILADRSVGGGPTKWVAAALRAARDFGADEIHAENNQGGDMVKMVLQQAMADRDFTVPVHLGFAKASKAGRAEPVATLYDRKEVKHVGPAKDFEALETQMVYLHEGEDPTGEDFDRCDALVWGLTRLGLKKKAFSGKSSGAGFRTFGGIVNGAAHQQASSFEPGDWGDAEL